MKKQIAVITLIPRSGQFYAEQVRELFGPLVQVQAFSTMDRSVEQLRGADVYLVSTDAFEDPGEMKRYISADSQMVEIKLTYSKKVIQNLRKIPKGTRVLFVNATQQMAREAITQLEQLGVNQLRFEPYGPDSKVPDGVELAVTPDETEFVPKGIENVINIGHRPCTPGTLIEAALRLGIEGILEDRKFRTYMKAMAAGSYSFDEMFARSRKLESRFDLLMEILDEGMIGVNEEGVVYACNRKAEEITEISKGAAIGEKAKDLFPYIPFDKCMREGTAQPIKLIKIGMANVNVLLTPVFRRGECIGAFAALQPFSELEKRQNELRSQMVHKGYRAKYRFEDVIGSSKAIERTRQILLHLSASDAPVLLIGETGTGKEMFAHGIHHASKRSTGPFLAINVAAVPENLLESELFGYEEGAFTGAKKGGRIGVFELANRGTLFLDEIEDMSPAMQVKLLRVLQEKEFMRVGGNHIIRSDVRIVAATNEQLEAQVREGRFRKDLYYRLNVLPVLIPPLRARGEDILILLEEFFAENWMQITLSEEVKEVLLSYNWPGNVRELQNLVEYLKVTGRKMITVEELPPGFSDRRYSNESGAEECGEFGESDFYWFVLGELYRASEQGVKIGREAIQREAQVCHLPLSQKEIRGILSRMSDEGIVRVSRGRGGSQITPIGRKRWEEHK